MDSKTNNNIVYSGKAKHLVDNGDTFFMEFTDKVTAFNGEKNDVLEGKGSINNKINTWFMLELAKHNIPTHFLKSVNDNTAEVRKLHILPLECIMRNYASGSICKRLGLEDRTKFSTPIYQLCLKDDALGDPVVSEYEALALGWANQEQLNMLHDLTVKINNIMRALFDASGFILADFKLEFGIDKYNKLYLADEITPDGCRIWDTNTGEIFDKDRYRKDLGSVIAHYNEFARRLGII